MRQLDDLTPGEIKTAAEAVLGEGGTAGITYGILARIAERLDSSMSSVPAAWGGTAVQRRFEGRVKRALDALSGAGTLVKVPAGGLLPDGSRLTNREVRYYSPGAYEAARAEGERAHAERIAAARRWADVSIRLAKVGIEMDGDHRLSLGDWDRLLGTAGL